MLEHPRPLWEYVRLPRSIAFYVAFGIVFAKSSGGVLSVLSDFRFARPIDSGERNHSGACRVEAVLLDELPWTARAWDHLLLGLGRRRRRWRAGEPR
jgi:hypothetical protein